MFVSINRIHTRVEDADTLITRFADSVGLNDQPGILGFELLRRTWQGQAHGEGVSSPSETEEFLVQTRWDSQASFEAWLQSDAFKKAHAKPEQDAAAGEAPAMKPIGSQAAGYDVVLDRTLELKGAAG